MADATAWSAAFGVGVGLMPLARTMMISFAPVLLFVAVVHALGHRAPRRRQALNAVLAGVLSVVVAATWLWPSAQLVFGYLTEYGYGKHSAEYAGNTALPPVRVLAAFGQDFFAPHLLLIAAGWLLVVVVPGRWRRDGRSFVTVLQDVAASPVFPCIGLVLGASAALMTSDNGGFGFTLPLLAPAIVAAAAGWTRGLGSLSKPSLRRAGVAALGLVCLVLVVPSFGGSSWLARQRSVDVLGASVNVTNGLHTDPAYVFGRTYARTTDPDKLRNSPRWGADWERAAVRLVGEVLDGSTKRREYAFGFRDRYMNVNTVGSR